MTLHDEHEVLWGGIVNANRIFRKGNVVHRPSGSHTPAIHAFLTHLREAGFEAAPQPLGVNDEHELLSYIPGEVPHYPYDDFCKSDKTLVEVAKLVRRFHDASATFKPSGELAELWNTSLANPGGGTLICHNDIRPENVVFSNGKAVGLLDFDFTAPGEKVWDLAKAVVLWIPIDDPVQAHSYNYGGLDPFKRMRLFCDSYGLDLEERVALVDAIDPNCARSEGYVREQVDAGAPAFIELWNKFRIGDIYERRRAWLAANRPEMLSAISL